jgi:hypothetical protein
MGYFQIKNKAELAVLVAAIVILAVTAVNISVEQIFTNASAQTDLTNLRPTVFYEFYII